MVLYSPASIKPDSAASDDPIAKAATITVVILIPMSLDALRLSEQARIAIPMRVFFKCTLKTIRMINTAMNVMDVHG